MDHNFVTVQISFLIKSFPTDFTTVRFLSSMDPVMNKEKRVWPEHFPAVEALMALKSRPRLRNSHLVSALSWKEMRKWLLTKHLHIFYLVLMNLKSIETENQMIAS